MERLLNRLKRRNCDDHKFNRFSVPGRICYIVSHSYPHSSDGYAVRTHGISSTLVSLGYSVIVINRPGNPWDLPGYSSTSSLSHQKIDGVTYLYLSAPSEKEDGSDYPARSVDALKEYLRVFKPGAVMAASDWETALPVAVAARELDLRFFYEVRGFWEISLISRDPKLSDSENYRRAVKMETEVAKAADQIFTLNRFMREELVNRGIQESKISILPNGYRSSSHYSDSGSIATGTNLQPQTGFVIGYVGAFSEYEGLEDLVQACALVRNQGTDISLLLVGSSAPAGLNESKHANTFSMSLMQLAKSLDFAPYLHLTGRIPAEEVAHYYDLIDLFVIPRKPLPVCNLVSPLKPLEAAAYGKAILVSDVKPLEEMACEAGVFAIFEAGNTGDLALKIKELVHDEIKLKDIGRKYSAWVSEQRSWPMIMGEFTRIYPETKQSWEDKSVPALRTKTSLKEPITSLLFDKPAIKSKPKLRIASILDTFSHACFEPICELVPITPSEWKKQVKDQNIDMVLVESAWHGNDDTWLYRVAKYDAPPGNELQDVISWARKLDIPTVFWNKEDPPNFERFIDCASQFDFIFTTDQNCVERYKQRVPTDVQIEALPFAAQHAIHNPHMGTPRLPISSFAGTYYADDFSSRREAMDRLLRAAARFGLDIFDRMYHAAGKDKERYRFPADLQPYVRGTLNYEEMLKAYRRYRVGLNVNSVSDSPTMFSRRVFELMACGTPVVSTYSKGILCMFDGLVSTVETPEDAESSLQKLMTDPQHWLARSTLGIRTIFQKHTYSHRLKHISELLGLQTDIQALCDVVLVVRPSTEFESFVKALAKQNLRPKEVIVIGHKHSDIHVKKGIQDISSLGIRTNAFPRENITDYLRDRHANAGIVFCDTKHYYGPSYILDAAISLSGDPLVQSTTMHPTENSESYLKGLQFQDLDILGMDVTSLFWGTTVAKPGCKIIEELFLSYSTDYLDVEMPVMQRPWVEFMPKNSMAKQCNILEI